MLQAIELTRDEKIAMYMKLSKIELIELLLNSQMFAEQLARRSDTPMFKSE